MAPGSKDTRLTASYKSPENDDFTITHALPTTPSTSTSTSLQDKTHYLEALRKAVTAAQEQINRELTTRMEQDKAREAAPGGLVAATLGTDEDKEEENYGEEFQEVED